MAAPYTSGAIWETLIQQPAIALLENLISQVQEVRDTNNPAFEIPTIKVYKDYFQPDQREQAMMMLGVDFSRLSDSPCSSSSLSSISSSQADFMVMTVLQYGVLSLFAGQPEDTDQRELVIEMLIKSLSPEEINGQLFGNDNNALHLAAFLRMESTLHTLIAYGGNPLLPNGRGLSAFDILFEVTPAGLDPPTSLRSHRASYPSCSFKENMEPATTTLTRDASLAMAKIARPSEGPHPTFQPFSSTATGPSAHENVYRNKGQNEDEADYNRATPIRSTAECEDVGDSESLKLNLDDGPQVFQQTEHCGENSLDDLPSRDAFGRSLVCDNKAFADGYDHDDLEGDSGNSATHLVEKDAQDMDPYYFHRNELELQFLQEQFELDEFERLKTQLHEDLTCFLRIRPDGPILTAAGAPLVSILKNRQAWRPEDLSIEHAQSFEAYEDYTERLQLQRKPDDSHQDDSRHQPAHEKCVRWNNIKQVREYQRHMNCQLEVDGWDGLLVSEPYDEPVDDRFVPTASPYDIVRPVTPVRPRNHALGMAFNNSSLDLSDEMGRASSPLPHGSFRPLPEIPQSAKSSFFGYRKGTPPPPSFLSKAKATFATTASSFTTQVDEQAKSSSSRTFSKRLSASSLLWTSKRPGSPFAKISFSSSDIQLRSSSVASSPDGDLAEPMFALGQRDSTEVSLPLGMDSSQWVPRILRNLTSPPSSLSKSRSRSSLDSSQSIPRTQTVQEMLLQAAPFSISSDMSLHGERPTIVDYDTIFPGSVSSPSVTSTTAATPKMFSQLKSALKEKFSTPSLPYRASSSTPMRCVSTPPILPPIPLARSLSEPSSSNTSTCEFPEFPAHESSLGQRNNNSSVMSEAGIAVNEAHEDEKALASLHQRRPSASAISIDQVDHIRAHIPRVTSPLAKVSYSRSKTRSPQLHLPTAQYLGSDSDEAETEIAEHDQNGLSAHGPRAASPLPQVHPQSVLQSTHCCLSLANAANQFLGNFDSRTPTPYMPTTEIKEDPNRPALPERPPSRSGSGSSSPSLLPSCSNAQTKCMEGAPTAVVSHYPRPSETSVTNHTNWTTRKEVVLVHPPRTSSLPSVPVAMRQQTLEQDQDLISTAKELPMEEVPVCGVNDRAEAEIVGALDVSVLSDAESVPVTPISPLATLFPLQPADGTNHYQNTLVKSTGQSAKATPQYVLPKMVFTAEAPGEMEYIHGVTHATSSVLVTDPQGESKSTLMGAALVNIQGISHGLEVQKYNLRQSTVVERFSDVDLPSLALSLPETSLQPIYQERYASLWMDVGEFESRPRRSTLSNCESPSTTQTGVLYMRFKKVCNFSLPMPGENTMVSIRIDTGYEKVDTDYVPLEDIDMIINQEFCLPVCPGLAITITLHLMQAPHLQPRYLQQHILPPIAAYSLPSHAISGSSSSNTPYTLDQLPLDRPPSESSYMQKSLPALPSCQQHHHEQQQERLRTPTSGSVFSSIGKRSLLSSLFNKRSQPSSPSSLVFGTARFGSFNALSPSRPGTSGWRRPSSPQVHLNEHSPPHGTGEGTTSLFGNVGYRSNRAALSADNAVSISWVNNNSSSTTTIERSSTPSPLPVASSARPPTTGSSTSSHARFLQHSESTSSTSTSTSTSASESSLSTPPSSCGSPDEMTEGEKKSRSGSGTFAKWTKGFLNPRKKNPSQSKQRELQPRLPSRSATPILPSPATTTGSLQQLLPVDQEQWLAYWKELGEQHRRGSNGSITTGRSFSPRASSSQVVANHTFPGKAPLSTDPPFPFSDQGLSDVINNHISNNSEKYSSYNNSYNAEATVTTINNAPVPFLPQLTQAQIRATESPLEILSRHILFDDELCIARTGIVFEEIRAACTNQIVNIEFQTVNNWIDLNDYSRIGGQLGKESPSLEVGAKDIGRCSTPALTSGHIGKRDDGNENDHNANADEDDEEDEEDGEVRSLDRDTMVANIQTTVCFIPGPEMDPEDAIYEDQQALPSEPQNLVDCHMGLKYFHWQDRVSFRGALFFSTGNLQQQRWREGRFCIVGSVLWQCRPPTTLPSRSGTGHNCQGQDEQEEEKWRCLDLSLVHGIETSLGYFNARARYLETADIDHPSNNANEQRISTNRVRDVSEDYYPVRNGFRLCMAKENSIGNQRTVFNMEFYAESAELGQKWVSALVEACRERPPAPYWIASTTTA